MKREQVVEKINNMVNGEENMKPLSEMVYESMNKVLDSGSINLEEWTDSYGLPKAILAAILLDISYKYTPRNPKSGVYKEYVRLKQIV